jgi:hypothetical protein
MNSVTINGVECVWRALKIYDDGPPDEYILCEKANRAKELGDVKRSRTGAWMARTGGGWSGKPPQYAGCKKLLRNAKLAVERALTAEGIVK